MGWGRSKGAQWHGHGKAQGAEGAQKESSVPEDFQLDEEARFTGTVEFYNKWRGYGFIALAQKDVVPDDRVFVHWSSLQSTDRFPLLTQGKEVEFSITKWRQGLSRAITLRTKAVTAPGGAALSLQDAIDKKKEFVGCQDLRYTGTLKFYDATRGFGYVTIDAGYYKYGEESVPSELRVERAEVNAGGSQPLVMQDMPVEFGIWKTKRGAFKVHNMTFHGGVPMTQAAVEHRTELGGPRYLGEVKIYNWSQGWGFIELDNSQMLESIIQEKLAKQMEVARQRATMRGKTQPVQDELIYFRKSDCKPGISIGEGSKVTFDFYYDDKGVGASNIE